MSKTCHGLKDLLVLLEFITGARLICLSNSHINPSLVENVSNQPAEQHKADGKKKGTEVHTSVFEDILE